MAQAREQQAFYQFMEEYTGFLERMVHDERDRLSALQTRSLPRIENSIAASQANTMQFENYEMKRISAQAAAGWEGLTFRQLLEAAPPEDRQRLDALLARFERHISDIRFYNEKCMAVARDNMLEIDPSAVLPAHADAEPNPYRTMRKQQVDQTSILETKI